MYFPTNSRQICIERIHAVSDNIFKHSKSGSKQNSVNYGPLGFLGMPLESEALSRRFVILRADPPGLGPATAPRALHKPPGPAASAIRTRLRPGGAWGRGRVRDPRTEEVAAAPGRL